ncbi:hypothetical protein THUN1379_26910 [Paludibacterium sp. THUN1379]|uniref:AlpA family phage regulatory protein n=1 Tax=Paludibacterium sp. THUN1379 TaxID=3112107 RepID=UPI00308D8A8B|nr:hypothetical protein THUN1379_26910 [Paludibacterium sp. THUN1379]
MQTSLDCFTRQKAAEYLGVSVHTLNQWASEGKGPRSIRVGRQCVYKRDDLEKFRGDTQQKDIHQESSIAKADCMLRLPEVMRRTGMSRSWIYSKIKSKEFPLPVHLGSRAIAWRASSVDNWIAARLSVAREVA